MKFVVTLVASLLLTVPASAWTKSTIGSGGDYATLTLWENAVDGLSAGDYEAELISDISDAVTISGVTAGTNLWIHSAAGHRYKVTATAAQMFYVNQTTDALSVLVEDVEFDANATGADSAWYIRRLTGPFTARRCIIHNGTSYGVDIENAALANTPTVTFENCLVYDFSAEGIFCNFAPIAQTVNITNCGVYDCLRGMFLCNDADLTINARNSWFLNNSTADITMQGDSVLFAITNCVLSKSAVGGGTPDTSSGNAFSKTDYASYFVSPGSDFHLLADDNTLWGVNGDSGTTPATDLDGVTRTGDDIGPYDFAGGSSYIFQPNMNGNLTTLNGNMQ